MLQIVQSTTQAHFVSLDLMPTFSVQDRMDLIGDKYHLKGDLNDWSIN